MTKTNNLLKSKLLIGLVLFCVVISIFCVSVNAQEEAFVIDSNEIYMEVPAKFQFCPYDLSCNYYFFTNNEGQALFVDCFENSYGLQKASEITQEKVEEITSLMFFAEGNKENLQSLKINYHSFSQTMVNGINIFVLEGNFFHTGSSDEASGFGICFLATKESLFFISMQTSYKDFDKKEDLLLLMGDVKINGTFLQGDSPSYDLKFSSSKFKDVVKNDVQKSFVEYEVSISEKYAQEDASLNQQEYEEIRGTLYKGAYIISAVSVTLLIFSFIFLYKKYKKNKKVTKEDTSSEI